MSGSAFASEDRDIEFGSGDLKIPLRIGPDVPPPTVYTEFLAENLPDCSGLQTLDLGTGCGALAVLLAKAGAAGAAGLDVNPLALEYAKRNAIASGVREKVFLFRSDFRAWNNPRVFDLIVCNPPQIPTPKHGALDPAADWSEFAAVEGGADGRQVMNPLLERVPGLLAPGGRFLMVQAAFTGWEESLERLRDGGLEVTLLARKGIEADPLVSARAGYIESIGYRFRREAGALRYEVGVLSGVRK